MEPSDISSKDLKAPNINKYPGRREGKGKIRLLVAESEKVAVDQPYTLSSCWSLNG
jgi:hypothetical protein